MALKNERIVYRGRNGATGLSDVTATIRRNGVQVATAVACTEINSTTEPGCYQLLLTPTMITGYGGAGLYDFYINSASQYAPAIQSKWILVNDEDDLAASLAGEAIAIASIKSDTTQIIGDVESGTYGLSAIKTLIDTLQSSVASIQNNTRFSASLPVPAIIPTAGSTTFRVPFSLFNTQGSPEDPDSQQIAVTIANASGVSRKSYLVGYVSEVAPLYATRDQLGTYRVDFAVPYTAAQEELIFSFYYAENTIPFLQRRVTETILDVASEGFALQTTLLDVQEEVEEIELDIQNATYGLAALKTLIDTKASQTSVDAIQTDITNNVEGTGFDNSTDSLHQISLRLYNGGVAVVG